MSIVTAHTSMVYPRVLYDNALNDDAATVSYSGTELAGYQLANALDWFDYTSFLAEASATTYIEATWSGARTIDSWAIWVAPYTGSSSLTVNLKVETGLATGIYNTEDTIVVGTDGALIMAAITEYALVAGQKVRVEFVADDAVAYIRQVAVGTTMISPMGQQAGITPPNLNQGIIVDNQVSVNGSIIGRNYRRVERRNTLDLEYLTEAWIRSTWEPFVSHAVRKAFFYQWDLDNHPTEVVLATAAQINAPENGSPPGTMRVTMPLHCLAEEGA